MTPLVARHSVRVEFSPPSQHQFNAGEQQPPALPAPHLKLRIWAPPPGEIWIGFDLGGSGNPPAHETDKEK